MPHKADFFNLAFNRQVQGTGDQKQVVFKARKSVEIEQEITKELDSLKKVKEEPKSPLGGQKTANFGQRTTTSIYKKNDLGTVKEVTGAKRDYELVDDRRSKPSFGLEGNPVEESEKQMGQREESPLKKVEKKEAPALKKQVTTKQLKEEFSKKFTFWKKK